MAETKYHDNRLGIWGWFAGGRWGPERYAYTLHRITGLAVLCYFLMHIVVTSLRAKGIYLWEDGEFLHQPIFLVGEFLVFAAFAYHAFNGLRLVLIEFGWAVGKAEDPVYPYKSSLNKQRPLLALMMLAAAMVIALGAQEFIHALGGMH